MRPVEFAPEAIIQAGQELQATGRNLTGFALRQKVGGGNPTRLKQVWDEHINSQTTAKAEPVAELPVEVAEEVATVTKALTERLAALAVELNDKAVKAAERRVHEVVRAAGEQREQAERELVDASQTVDDLENKLDEAASIAAGLEKRLADSQASHQAQAVELAQVRERLALIEQTVKAGTEQHAAEVARLNASIGSERQRHQQEAEQLRAELAKVQAKAEAAEESHQEQRKQVAAEAQRTAERMTKTETERDDATKAAIEARERAAGFAGQLQAMQEQNAALLAAIKPQGERNPK
jgi:colicin import membrane protein